MGERRPMENKGPPPPLQEGSIRLPQLGGITLVYEQLRVEKLGCSPLPAFAPPPREPMLILDFGEEK
ncbi:UNVERIFIED_CONTAM: hypothetical protein Sangu_1723200 [Sesamum angustifolium]|uniref:Uncharacterized protein n=1 Tax=Sesamum angustifolium TaxID=2727405 RepID=A0AAW2MKI3_9LAMI